MRKHNLSLLTVALALAPIAANALQYTAIDLGTLGGTLSFGFGINASGQVTGTARTSGDSAGHAFITDAVTHAMTDLGTLGGTSSRGQGINASGQVTGAAQTASADFHVFITDAATHKLTDLGTLGGTSGSGNGINDSGQVTGQANTANERSHAFITDAVTNKLIDLGTLSGSTFGSTFDRSQGRGINASGQVTGFSGDIFENHGFLYTDGQMLDLNALLALDAAALYTIVEGQGINDSGQIVANGLVNATGQRHAFLLTPVPLPAAAWLFLSALGGLGCTRRRIN